MLIVEIHASNKPLALASFPLPERFNRALKIAAKLNISRYSGYSGDLDPVLRETN